MRCSKCGKRIRKKSSFCIKCGAKVPPVPKKEKKSKKGRKKRSKIKIAIPVAAILILAALTFLLFGGDRVPDRIRSLKGYSYLTGMVKEKIPAKLPVQIKLPFDLPEKLPFELPDKLPFDFSIDLPDPGGLLGGKIPDKEKIMEDLAAFEGGEDSKPEFDSLEIEKRTTAEKEKKDTIYVITETEGEEGIRSGYYRLLYKRHLIGGWKLDEVEPYNVEGEKTSVAGVDNKAVVQDEKIYTDMPSDWKHSNVKVLEHFTNVKAGTDTVVVYMELENQYVNMTGTKEVTYQYNNQSKAWEAASVSKMTALSIEPVDRQ